MKKVRILAIITAIVTAVAVYMYLSNMNKPNEIEMASIIVPKEIINANTEITREMLGSVNIPVDAVHINAALSFDDVVGKASNGLMVQDEQIITSKLIEPGESQESLAYAVEDGQRAFTLAVDKVSGIAGFLQPGNYVDILLTLTIDLPDDEENNNEENSEYQQDIRKTFSIELISNLKLLAVGRNLNERDISSDEGIYDTITLSVTPEQAVKLNLAANSGKVRLTLRSPLDDKTTDTDMMEIEELLE